MEMTPLFLIIIAIIGCLLIGLNLFLKKDIFVSITISLACMFSGFIGFLNYASLSENYPNRKLLTIFFAICSFLPCILNFLQTKCDKIKPLFTKIFMIIILAINLLLIILFKVPYFL